MANKYNVTRTIITKKVTCLCIELATAEPFNKTFTYSGNTDDKGKVLKTLRKTEENDEFSIASIVDIQEVSALFGMTEADFITHAVMLNPETRKPYEAETEEE